MTAPDIIAIIGLAMLAAGIAWYTTPGLGLIMVGLSYVGLAIAATRREE